MTGSTYFNGTSLAPHRIHWLTVAIQFFYFNVALRPQRPYGLLRTRSSTSSVTQFLSSDTIYILELWLMSHRCDIIWQLNVSEALQSETEWGFERLCRISKQRELTSPRKTSHEHNNKDPSRLRWLTWHASKYNVHKLHHRHIFCVPLVEIIFLYLFTSAAGCCWWFKLI